MADSEEQKSVAPAAGNAYGGLVPRKSGEFHHHFTSKLPMTQCVHCGGTVYEPCRGSQADEWEERMQARRALKERLFWLAYGVSKEGHREAARQMAEFNAETLRLFPDRFREPTPDEVKAREQFDRMLDGHIRQETEGRFTAPATEDDETKEQIQAFAWHTAELDGDAHIHGWRTPSGHTITPGECPACVRAGLEIDARNEQIRAAKEAAWDEGREAESDAHFADGGYGNVQHPKNPYRKDDRD